MTCVIVLANRVRCRRRMATELEYRQEVTPDLARSTAAPLGQALWLHQQRRYAGLRRARPALRLAGAAVSLAGVAVCWFAWLRDPRNGDYYTGFAGVFGALALVFPLLGRLQPRIDAFARRRIGDQARRTMEGVARLAPYVAAYRLSAGVLEARVEKLNLSVSLALRDVRFAVEAPAFICAFPRRGRSRILYLPGPPQRGALLDALAAAGVPCVELS